MPALNALLTALETIAPTRHAESWDNVGLLLGDPAAVVSRVLLTIDLTRAVAAECERENCDAVVAYHPPIFKPISRLIAGDVLFELARRGVAVYSPHTALDVADGGTNDVLADVAGLIDRSPIRPLWGRDDLHKLATFIPSADLEKVANALFAAGAGSIGAYDQCSFRSSGTGTFRGGPETNPTVGQPGELARVGEVKFETILPAARVPAVVAALRAAHPYEEPAFDLIKLAAAPASGGMGRVGSFAVPVTCDELVTRLKSALNISALLVAGPTDKPLSTAAVCAGSCGSLLDDVLARRVDCFVTGELRHHDALRVVAAGITTICTLHSNSERITLARLRDRLSTALPQTTFLLAQSDREPFSVL